MKTSAAVIQPLLASNDYSKALKVITATREMIEGDLMQINCLKATIAQLGEYERLISDTLVDKFEATALNFNFYDDAADDDVALADQLYPLAMALVQSGTMPSMFSSYKDKIKTEIAQVVKTVVSAELSNPGSKPGDAKDVNTSPANVSEQLKIMSPKAFVSLMECVYEHLLLITQRIARVNTILLGCLGAESLIMEEDDIAIPKEPEKVGDKKGGDKKGGDRKEEKPVEEKVIENKPMDLIKETHEILKHTCIITQKHVKKLFDVREELHRDISITDLSNLWIITFNFTDQCEKLTGKKVKILSDTFKVHTEANVTAVDKKNTDAINAEINAEDWKQVPVPSEIQDMVKSIHSTRLYAEKSAPSTLRKIVIGTEDFRMVKVMGSFLRMINDYLEYASKFPFVVTDVLKMVLAMLRLFNTRSTYLILGAGARQLSHMNGGITSINAKHLSMVAHSIGIMIQLLPAMNTFLGSIMPAQQHVMLRDLDLILDDYVKHRDKILDKFVEMINGPMEKSLAEAMSDQSWINDTKLKAPSPYVVKIEETCQKLHQVLSANLGEKDVLEVYSRFMVHISERLPEVFKVVDPKSLSSHGKSHVVGDITHLIGNIRAIGPLRELGHNLERHFRQRYGG